MRILIIIIIIIIKINCVATFNDDLLETENNNYYGERNNL